jgi:metallo-beta-lactamase family protein
VKLRHTQARVLFSGDIGNNFDHREVQPLLRHVMYPHQSSSLAFTESTYGAIRRDASAFDADARRDALAQAIRDGIARGGPILIPVFAIQRAQDVLWDLHVIAARDGALLDGVPILVDAPMAVQFNAILLRGLERDHQSPNGKVRPAWLGRHAFTELGLDPDSPQDLERLRRAIRELYGERPAWKGASPTGASETAGAAVIERVLPRWWRVDAWDRGSLIEADGPRIVLASGGMADFGPVQQWLAKWLEDPRATVLFAGYAGRNTLGGKLNGLAKLTPSERARKLEPMRFLDGRASVRPCDVKATLQILTGFSAHADQARLVDWAFPTFRDGTPFAVAQRLCITHGDASSRRELKAAIEARAAAAGLPIEIRLPTLGGPGIDVATGAAVDRDEVLGKSRELPPAGDVDVASLMRRVAELEHENLTLKRNTG